MRRNLASAADGTMPRPERSKNTALQVTSMRDDDVYVKTKGVVSTGSLSIHHVTVME